MTAYSTASEISKPGLAQDLAARWMLESEAEQLREMVNLLSLCEWAHCDPHPRAGKPIKIRKEPCDR